MSHYAALPKAVALAVPLTLGAWTVQAADIIQTAEQYGRFNGFLHLLEATGTVEKLKGEGPFTVFAPVDEAFGQLPPGVLEWLLAEESRKALEAVVQSHIVPGAALLAEDLLTAKSRLKRWAVLCSRSVAPPRSSWWSHSRPPLLTSRGNGAEHRSDPCICNRGPDAAECRRRCGIASAMTAKQELTAVAMVVEPDIEADNGVIHGIDLCFFPRGAPVVLSRGER